MNVIWTKMWCSLNNNWKHINFDVILKSTIKKSWLPYRSRESVKKNNEFNELLHKFTNGIVEVHYFLSKNWYKVVKIFTSDEEFEKFIEERSWLIYKKYWKVLIWNIYWEINFITCEWIVIATRKTTINEKVDKILERKNPA